MTCSGEIAGIPREAILGALKEAVNEARVRVRELEEERNTLRETYSRKDDEIRTEIREIEAQNKIARDALKGLAPPKSAGDMKREVEYAIFELLLSSAEEMAVSRILEGLTELSWEYEGRGFENRVRQALIQLESRDLVKFREVETQSKHTAKLWSIKNKRRKYVE